MTLPKKILVAPLNWGLGHATRCMPIIDELRRQGAEVILASDGAAYDLLKREYPDLTIHKLPAYNIRYPFRSMMLSMAFQMPKILRGAIGEHYWLKKFLKTTAVDVVISDNRFGFYNRKIHSIFMTHQVNILIPVRFFQPIVNVINHFFIKKFDVCWIPDLENTPNLAGELSHGHVSKRLKIKYLGVLSRFKKINVGEVSNLADVESSSIKKYIKKYKAAFILSGPEPQRSIFEKEIRQQLSEQKDFNEQYLIVRGTDTANNPNVELLRNLEVHNVLTSDLLNKKMMGSEVIICRSGYSSIMDLVYLQKAAVLIPTPGQTEQEYLADELMQKNQFFSQSQDNFDMQTALKAYKKYKNFTNSEMARNTLEEIIGEL